MGHSQLAANSGHRNRRFTTGQGIRGGAMATWGLLILIVCAFLNAAVMGSSDASGTLWLGILIGLAMLGVGIYRRLNLTLGGPSQQNRRDDE